MPAGTTIKHKRKAGAFSAGELAQAEQGYDITHDRWYYSPDGSAVTAQPSASSTVASDFSGYTSKATPVDADTLVINDSAASGALKRLTWANLKATLKTYFDALYQAASAVLSAFAALTPSADDVLQFKSGAWANRTPAQLKTDLALVKADVGLGSVTNDAQTKAAVMPNTAPSAGQMPIGNSGGTAYAPQSVSGDATLSSAGALTVTKTNGTAFGTAATKDVPASGNASTSQVVKGDDTRLSDARTPTSHVHSAADITSGTLSASRLPNVLPSDYISGAILSWNSATSITVSTGTVTLPDGNLLSITSAIVKSSLSLSASTWYHVYVYNNSGTPAAEVVTTAPVLYAGTAYQKTGDNTKRYVGSVKTDGSGNVINFLQIGNRVFYRADTSGSILRAVSNGTATTETNASLSSVVPVTSRLVDANFINTSTAQNVKIGTSDDGLTQPTNALMAILFNTRVRTFAILDSSQQFAYAFDAAPGSGLYVDVNGYLFDR